MRRLARVIVAIATIYAIALIVWVTDLAWGASAARRVSFVGGWGNDEASCDGPVVWTGKAAWATCNWAYKNKALVELDPEQARATVLYRWTEDDGNSPVLRVVRPCGDRHLFVISEERQTTLVTIGATGTSGQAVPVAGKRVLGAACRDGAVELFARQGYGYSILRARNGQLETVRGLGEDSVPGDVLGAWFDGGRWQVVFHPQPGSGVMVGEPGGSYAHVDGLCGDACCLMGEPGGWLQSGDRLLEWCAKVVVSSSGAFHMVGIPNHAEEPVLHTAGPPVVGYTVKHADTQQFRGLGSLDFDLRREGKWFEASRPGHPPTPVAFAPYSAFDVGAMALPLSGNRVAIWGDLGKKILILGPDLRRQDRIAVTSRSLLYVVLLVGTCAWLLLLLLGRRWPSAIYQRRVRFWAVMFVLLVVLDTFGFRLLAPWI